jgi:NhaA family Na+:H+ antiporter
LGQLFHRAGLRVRECRRVTRRNIAFSPQGADPLGIIVGLFLGKQLGVFGAAMATIKCGFSKLPAGASNVQLYGIAMLTGIGFTMSLFIGTLAFGDESLLAQVRLGVLDASILSALGGAVVLKLAARAHAS